jgi:hypothetical protein
MKMPHMVPHDDLIDNLEFGQWFGNKYPERDLKKINYAYFIVVKGARTHREAVPFLKVRIDSVSRMIRAFNSAAEEYKAELNEKI